MGSIVKEKGGKFVHAPVGNHVAICYRLIELGTQHSEYPPGTPITREQILIGWELPNELMDDGKPFVTAKFYTKSLNEKATLRHDLESWRSRAFTDSELNGFDLKTIIGKPCLLSIVEDKGKHKVMNVSAVAKGMVAPKTPVNPVQSFWIDEWDEEIFKTLPEGIQEIIKRSDEFKTILEGKDDLKDDVPWTEEQPPLDDGPEVPF